MSEQLIISVSREYGSGGHEIAQKLAEYYKLPMYDHNLLDEVAASMNVSSKSWLSSTKRDVINSCTAV